MKPIQTYKHLIRNNILGIAEKIKEQRKSGHNGRRNQRRKSQKA